MSRSYKKNAIVKDNGSRKKFHKRQANKVVKETDLASGSAYKKAYCSWNICDWKWRVEKPRKGGRVSWSRHVSEEEMRQEYRKAKRK